MHSKKVGIALCLKVNEAAPPTIDARVAVEARMFVCSIKRFSIRTMLIAFLLVAIALFAIKEWRQLSSASIHYDRTFQAWGNYYVNSDDVIAASESLMNAEAETIWTSRERAVQRHLARLQYLLKQAERRVQIAHLEVKNAREKERDRLRTEINKYVRR